MPIYNIHITTPIRRSFRTEQVAGLFDLALDDLAEQRLGHTLTAELPGLDEDWTIGAIVGPSGSGKTTLARAAYGDAVVEPREWPEDEALIDALEGRSRRAGGTSTGEVASSGESRSRRAGGTYTLKHLLRVLAAVGLSSPPSWLRPYRVLSTGERFRADLARAILGVGGQRSGVGECLPTPDSRLPTPGLLVMDEFTSTLDRTVACTVSHGLGKFLRRNLEPGTRCQEPMAPDSWPLAPLRFIALSCHTDFLPWLAPDWILDLGASPPQLARGSLQRPRLRLRAGRVPQRLWTRFARHHYLSGGLSTAATCYAAFWDGDPNRRAGCVSTPMASRLETTPQRHREAHASRSPGTPIAFCAVVATLGWKRTKRITRLVVLPEFQGLGIGPRLAETVAAAEVAKGNRVTITASHPSVLAWCSRSPRWKYLGLKKTGSTRQRLGERAIRCSTGRAVASFEFVGEREA